MTAMRITGLFMWLTTLWVLLWGDLSAANLLAGIAIAAAVLTFARLPRLTSADAGETARLSPWGVVRFTTTVLVLLVQANMILAWEILTPRNRIHSGIVAVPLRTESQTAMLVVASVITLTPGTITLEATGSPAVLWVNVLHLHDLERVRRDLLRIEELSVLAFGSRTARAQLADRMAA